MVERRRQYDDDANGPTYRSAPPDQGEGDEVPKYRGSSDMRSCSNLTSARISRGSYAGVSPGVRSQTVVRAPEPLTVTSTIVVMCDGDEAPNVEQVKPPKMSAGTTRR